MDDYQQKTSVRIWGYNLFDQRCLAQLFITICTLNFSLKYVEYPKFGHMNSPRSGEGGGNLM